MYPFFQINLSDLSFELSFAKHPLSEALFNPGRSQTHTVLATTATAAGVAVLRLTLLLLLSVWAVQAEELETHWRKAKLPDSGRAYWWRPQPGTDDPEVSFTMPSDACAPPVRTGSPAHNLRVAPRVRTRREKGHARRRL